MNILSSTNNTTRNICLYKTTKRGLGIELWGCYDDLQIVCDVIEKFWNKEDYFALKFKCRPCL